MTIKLYRGKCNNEQYYFASRNNRDVARCSINNDPTEAKNWALYYNFGSGFHGADFPIKKAIADNAKVWLENGPAEFVISLAR